MNPERKKVVYRDYPNFYRSYLPLPKPSQEAHDNIDSPNATKRSKKSRCRAISHCY